MLDFTEKKASLADPDGRMMSMTHRGDVKNYPENSIEGIISACMMGADIIEIDVRYTKDGYAVLFHDDDTHTNDTTPGDDLVRTTNVLEVMGTVVNGIQLPESSTFTDWTFEQLRCLKLKTGKGGPNAAVTDYVIPTLEEALTVVKGRCFIMCDKITSTDSFKEIVLPYIKETGAYDTVILNQEFGDTGALEIQGIIKELSENTNQNVPFYLDKLSGSKPNTWQTGINENITAGLAPLFYFSGGLPSATEEDISLSARLDNNQANLETVKGSARIKIDCYGSNNGENAEMWARCEELGLNVSFVENVLALQIYIADTHFKN